MGAFTEGSFHKSVLSMDLRERALTACVEVLKTREVTTKYRVSESWVHRLLQRRREFGELTPRKGSGRCPKWIACTDTLGKTVSEPQEFAHHEITHRYALSLSVPPQSQTLHRLGLAFNIVLCAAEQDRPDLAVRPTP